MAHTNETLPLPSLQPRVAVSRPRPFVARVLAPVALCLGLGLFASTAHAQGPAEDKQGARVDRLCEKLECTDSQRSEIGAAFQELQAKIKPIREEMVAIRKELAAAYQADKLDTAKLTGLRNQLADKERAIEQLRFDAMVRLHPSLTPEQRAKIAKRLGGHGGGGKGGHGKGGKGGRGHGGAHGPHAPQSAPSTNRAPAPSPKVAPAPAPAAPKKSRKGKRSAR